MVFVMTIVLAAAWSADPATAQVADNAAAATGSPSCQCTCPVDAVPVQDNEPPAADDDTDQIAPPADEAGANTATDIAEPVNLKIVFSELLPDPMGTDTDGEFIEIRNDGSDDAALTGWSIRSKSEKIFNLPDVIIAAGSYRYFSYAESKIVLTNTGSELTLIDADGQNVDFISYAGPTKTGQSYAKNDIGQWQWTPLLTPGRANEFPSVTADDNVTPVADQSSDDATATDKNSDAATPAETNDSAAGATTSTTGATDADTPVSQPSDDTAAPATSSAAAPQVVISELLPNPVGDDSTEWIELANVGDGAAALTGWVIDDDPGGSKPSTIADTGVIPAGGFLLLPKSRTGLALNNDGDSVRLFNPAGAMVDAVAFASAAEGKSYAHTRAGWVWTDQPSPGFANEPEIIDKQAKNSISGILAPEGDNDDSDDAPGEVNLNEIADLAGLDEGEEITVRGVVNLPPGRLAKTLFSMQDAAGTAGIIVRLYGKTLPTMAVGEIWEMTGRIGRNDDEMRLNVTTADARPVGRQTLSYLEQAIADIDAGDDGIAMAITGLVASHGKNWLTMTGADGDGEIKITLPKGALIGPAEAGSEVSAQGVVRFREDRPELVLMDRKDLKMTAPEAGNAANAETADVAAKTSGPNRPALVLKEIPSSVPSGPAVLTLALLAAAATIGFLWWRRQRSCTSLAE